MKRTAYAKHMVSICKASFDRVRKEKRRIKSRAEKMRVREKKKRIERY